MATLDKPFASENGTRTYAGTISNIKQKNLARNFTAVGYIAYREDASSPWTYIYSASSAVRSIDAVATAALKDTTKNYSMEARVILEQLTVAYYKGIVTDPFGKDPF